MDILVHKLGKLVLSQENMVGLINLHNQDRFIDVLSMENSGCSNDEINDIMYFSLNELVQETYPLPDWDEHNHAVQSYSCYDQLVQTRLDKDNGSLGLFYRSLFNTI